MRRGFLWCADGKAADDGDYTAEGAYTGMQDNQL